MTAPDILERMRIEGQERWPSISVTPDALQRHCERRCADAHLLQKALNCAADVYLCCACANGDPVAQAMLQRECGPGVRSAIARVNRDPEFVQDTLQEFWKKLLVGPDARVRNYCGRGPLHAWLHLCATRLAIDHQRSRRAVLNREAELEERLIEQTFDAETNLTHARFYGMYQQALRRAIAGISHKDRVLMRLHVVERCSIDQIGRAHNVHRATAARWLQRILTHLINDVRHQLEQGGAHLTDSEFHSVGLLLGGDLALDVSLFSEAETLESDSSLQTQRCP